MLTKLKPKSEFSKNVLMLMTGTTIAQAIPIAISPILSRVYTPEDFGVLALYMALTSIIAVIATGRYELAIILPQKDEDAINIMVLSIAIAFVVSFIIFIIVLAFNEQITNLLRNSEISNWLYLVPLTVLLTGIFQSFNYWMNRKKYYKNISTANVLHSSTSAGASIGTGLNGFSINGLILGQIIGQGIAASALGKMTLKQDNKILSKIKISRIITLSKKYINFPKFFIVAHWMNAVSGQLPVLLLSNLFSLSIAGYFSLTRRILTLPMGIIAGSIGNVFRQQASYEYANDNNCRALFVSTFKKLLLISFVPFSIFYFVVPDLFALVFGENWRVAGEYAQILTPMYFVQFITMPISLMFIIANKPNYDLIWQIFLVITVGISFVLFRDEKICLYMYSISQSIMYFIAFILSYVLTINKGKNGTT